MRKKLAMFQSIYNTWCPKATGKKEISLQLRSLTVYLCKKLHPIYGFVIYSFVLSYIFFFFFFFFFFK